GEVPLEGFAVEVDVEADRVEAALDPQQRAFQRADPGREGPAEQEIRATHLLPGREQRLHRVEQGIVAQTSGAVEDVRVPPCPNLASAAPAFPVRRGFEEDRILIEERALHHALTSSKWTPHETTGTLPSGSPHWQCPMARGRASPTGYQIVST